MFLQSQHVIIKQSELMLWQRVQLSQFNIFLSSLQTIMRDILFQQMYYILNNLLFHFIIYDVMKFNVPSKQFIEFNFFQKIERMTEFYKTYEQKQKWTQNHINYKNKMIYTQKDIYTSLIQQLFILTISNFFVSNLQKQIEIAYMLKGRENQSKECFNFSKHVKNTSFTKIANTPKFQPQNKANIINPYCQPKKYIAYQPKKQFKEISTIPVKGHKRVVSMFTSQRQKNTQDHRLSIDRRSPIEQYMIPDLDKGQTPTFSFIQSSKNIQVKFQQKQANMRDSSILPQVYNKKNYHQTNNNIVVKKADNKLELINEIIFFKNKLEAEIMKNKQLSMTYEQFLDENYQLKQLNINHINWYLLEENQYLKEKLKILQQFQYQNDPETPKKLNIQRKIQKNQNFFLETPNLPNHNSPIKMLYPFQ